MAKTNSLVDKYSKGTFPEDMTEEQLQELPKDQSTKVPKDQTTNQETKEPKDQNTNDNINIEKIRKKRIKDDIVNEFYTADATEEYIYLHFKIPKSLDKKISWIRTQWEFHKKTKLPVNKLAQNAVEEYVQKLYKEFQEKPLKNPFEEDME